MAEKDSEIAIKLVLETDKANLTLKELEDGFEAMNAELKETGRGTERFKELSTAMAQTSVEIQNVEASFEGLDSNAVAGEMGALAGGIGEVTASLVLMGGENETIEQIAASIETALAISMGFKGAIEGVSAASKIYTDLQNKGKLATIAKSVAEKAAAIGTGILTAAQWLFNAAITANPIGIIIVAVAGLVAGFLLLGGTIMGLIDTALAPFQWAIDAVVDALQWLGIMESDSAIATREAEEAKADAAIESARKRVEETEKLIEAHKKLTDSITDDLDWEIRKRKANGEDTTEIEIKKLEHLIIAAKEEQKLQKKRREDLQKELELRGRTFLQFIETSEGYVDSLEKTEKAREDQFEGEQDLEIALIELKKETAEKEELIRKDSSKKKKATKEKDKAVEEKAAVDAIALEKDKIKLLDDLEAKAIEDKNVRALAELENTQKREREALKEKFGKDTELLKALTTEQELAMDTLIADIEKEARDKKAEADQLALDKELENIETAKQAKIEAAQITIDLALTTLSEISSVAGAYADADVKAEEERFNNLRATKQLTEKQLAAEELKTSQIKDAIRKKQFENEKKMQLATAAMNGAQALVSILSQYPKFDGGFAMIAALAGSVITTAASIAKIKSTTFSSTPSAALATLPSGDVSPDGAGDGGGGVQLSPVSNTSTILGNQQVFVTETDITSTQNNVSVIEESATF